MAPGGPQMMPWSAFTSRAIFFAEGLHYGALDAQLQSCAKMNEYSNLPEIQSEAALHQMITDLNDFVYDKAYIEQWIQNCSQRHQPVT